MIARVNKLRRMVSLLLAALWLCAGMMPVVVWATDPPAVQLAQASTPPAPAAAAKAPPPVPITDADLKAIAGPKPDDLAKGDPGGTRTGSVNDIVLSDNKKGPDACRPGEHGRSEPDRDQLRLDACHWLPRNVHAGGLRAGRDRTVPRKERQSHHDDELHGVWIRAVCLLGDGLRVAAGRLRAEHQSGRSLSPLNSEFAVNFLGGKSMGILFGQRGFFLSGSTYDVGVMVMFLFQMVFMDTAATIVTGAAAERWKFAAFAISSMFLAAITYPLYGNWAWGGGMAVATRHELSPGPRLLRLRGFGGSARGGRCERTGGVDDYRGTHW